MSRLALPKPEVMRNLQWESEGRRQMEFRVAAHYLRNTADVDIPTRHKDFQYEDPLTHQRLDRLTYRFSKAKNGVIYAHAAGKVLGADGVTVERQEGVLGQGSFGSVVLAEREDKSLWAVKEARFNRETEREAAVVDDLGLLGSMLQGQTTVTTTYRYLGVSLKTYLERNPDLTEEQRFSMAVKMFRALERLHSGAASQTGKRYAHLDLKLENFTIDERGDIHLIDFGFTTEGPEKQVGKIKGSPLTLIPDLNFWKYTLENLDVFAFMRVLFLPPMINCVAQHPVLGVHVRNFRRDGHASLFTDAMLANPLYKQIFGAIDLVGLTPPNNVLPSIKSLSEGILRVEQEVEGRHRVTDLLLPYGLEATPHIFKVLKLAPELERCITILREAGSSDKATIERVLLDIPTYVRHFSVLRNHGCVTKENIQKIFDSRELFERCVATLRVADLLEKVNLEKVLVDIPAFLNCATALDGAGISSQRNLQTVLSNILLFNNCLEILSRNHIRLTRDNLERVLASPERFENVALVLHMHNLQSQTHVQAGLKYPLEFERCVAALRETGALNKDNLEWVLTDIAAFDRHFTQLRDQGCLSSDNILKIVRRSGAFERCADFLIQTGQLNQPNLQRVLDKIELFDHCFLVLNRTRFLAQQYVTVVLNQPELFQTRVTLLVRQNIGEFDSVKSVLTINESNFDAFHKAVTEIKKHPHLNTSDNISKIRSASDKTKETVLILLEAGLKAAKEKTSDPVKKRLYDEFRVTDKTDLQFFVEKCVRILSHHTNIFRSRSDTKETDAFSAAKTYLESVRQLLEIPDARWRAVLRDKPDDKKDDVKTNMTYSFFKKEKKPSEMPGRDMGVSGALDGGSPGSGSAVENPDASGRDLP